jgi:hypothetical protein
MAGLAISLLIALIVGGSVVGRLVPSLIRREGGTPVLLAVGLGLGIGLTTISWFADALCGGLARGWILVDLALAALAILLSRPWSRLPEIDPGVRTPSAYGETGPSGFPVWVLVASLIAAGAVVAVYVVYSTLAEPHGWWDAWAIWNHRARFLYRGGSEWRRAFSQPLAWSHPDYPLLLPLAVARGWFLAGAESSWVPAGIGAAFLAATAALLYGALRILRGRPHGLAGAVLLLCAPAVLGEAPAQCADIPLAFYLLGATALHSLEALFPAASRGLAALSGLMAGCAAWTKNEGILALACFGAVRAVGAARGSREERLRLAAFATGAAPFVAIVVIFKWIVAPANDLSSEQTLGHFLATLVDPARHAAVATAFVRVATRDFLLTLVATAAAASLLGFSIRGLRRSGAAAPARAILLVALVEYVVYVTTPKPQEWQLATSLSRVALQFVPALLFLALAAADRVAEASPQGQLARASGIAPPRESRT